MNEYCTLQNKDELYDNYGFFFEFNTDLRIRYYLQILSLCDKYLVTKKNKQHMRHTFIIYFHNNNDQR